MAQLTQCPRCETRLELGSFTLDQTMVGYLVAGFAMPHLFFTNAKGERVSVSDWTGGDRQGYRCPSCGLSIVLPA